MCVDVDMSQIEMWYVHTVLRWGAVGLKHCIQYTELI